MIRNLRSPLTHEQLRPLEPECRLMQIGEPMTEAELREIAALAASHPDVELRVYGQRTVPDLEFLELFPGLSRFTVEVFELESIEGLRHLRVDLEHLGLGRTRSTAHSLRILERFGALRSLWLEGVGAIEYLEIWLVRGLSDLTPLAELKSLRYLFLQALKQVRRLRSLARLSSLRRAHVETMSGLEDLAPIADAPNLEQLLLVDMKHLSPDAVRPFVGHPALRAASLGLGSIRKNRRADDLLDLPDVQTPQEQLGGGGSP